VPQQEQGDAGGTTPDYSIYEVSGTEIKSIQELQGGNSEKGKMAGVASRPGIAGKSGEKGEYCDTSRDARIDNLLYLYYESARL